LGSRFFLGRGDLFLGKRLAGGDQSVKPVKVGLASELTVPALLPGDQAGSLQGCDPLLDGARGHTDRHGNGPDRGVRHVLLEPPVLHQVQQDVHVTFLVETWRARKAEAARNSSDDKPRSHVLGDDFNSTRGER